MKFSLDWNCVIEVEEGQPQADAVNTLIAAHRMGQIEVALLEASASENTKSKVFPGNAELFLKRVARLGWDDLPLVPMPGIRGLSYWDHAYYVDDSEAFERKFDAIWAVMAPRFARHPQAHLKPDQTLDDAAIQSDGLSKWRNTWCDAMSAYTHIHAKRDVFVTNNTRDFQGHAEALEPLGMTRIATPNDAVQVLGNLRLPPRPLAKAHHRPGSSPGTKTVTNP